MRGDGIAGLDRVDGVGDLVAAVAVDERQERVKISRAGVGQHRRVGVVDVPYLVRRAVVDDGGDGVEELGGLVGCGVGKRRGGRNIFIVHEHGLGQLQSAKFLSVGNFGLPDGIICIVLAGHSRLNGAVGAGVAGGHHNLDHLVGNLMTVVVLGQVLPGGYPSGVLAIDGGRSSQTSIHSAVQDDVALGQILHLVSLRAGDIAIFVQHIHGIGTDQAEGQSRALGDVIGINLVAFAVLPLFGSLCFGGQGLVLIGQTGDIGHAVFVRESQLGVGVGDLAGVGNRNRGRGRLRDGEGRPVLAHVIGNGNIRVEVERVLVGGLRHGNFGIAKYERSLTPLILDDISVTVVLIDALDHVGPVIGLVQEGVVYVSRRLSVGFGVFVVIERILVLVLRRDAGHLFPCVDRLRVGCPRLYIAPQFHLNGIRAYPITVVFVVPVLGDGHAVFSDISVHKADDVGGVAAAGGCVPIFVRCGSKLADINAMANNRCGVCQRLCLGGSVLHCDRSCLVNGLFFIVCIEGRLLKVIGQSIRVKHIIRLGFGDIIPVQLIDVGIPCTGRTCCMISSNCSVDINLYEELALIRRILGGRTAVQFADAVIMRAFFSNAVAQFREVDCGAAVLLPEVIVLQPQTGIPIKVLHHKVEHLVFVRGL